MWGIVKGRVRVMRYGMNGIAFEQYNNLIKLYMPNWVQVADVMVPPDGRKDMDFDLLDGITTLISKRQGLIEGDLKELRKLKMPTDIIIRCTNNTYNIFIKELQIATVALGDDMVSAKITVGISVLLHKRWASYIKRQTQKHNLIHSPLTK